MLATARRRAATMLLAANLLRRLRVELLFAAAVSCRLSWRRVASLASMYGGRDVFFEAVFELRCPTRLGRGYSHAY